MPEIGFEAISIEELELIRQIWLSEEHDWQDSLPLIYQKQKGLKYPFPKDDGVIFTKDDHVLLEEVCSSEMEVSLIAKLIDLERKMEGMSRRAGINNKIDKIFSEEWRTEGEIEKAINSKKAIV